MPPSIAISPCKDAHKVPVAHMKLEDKTVLITGAGSGLGLETVDYFISQGANILGLDLSAANGEALVKKHGDRVLFCAADVCSEKEVKAAIAAGVDKFGSIDVVINCAGVGRPRRVVSTSGKVHSMRDFEFVLKINLFGSFNVLRLAAGQMAAQAPDAVTSERGVIVNTASVAAFDGQIGQASYSASKAALAGMSLPLARDLAPHGIRVVTIAPGIFDTPMMKSLDERTRASLMKQVPFPARLGHPHEFAQMCAHIVENQYLNGTTIRLDGSIRMAAM